MENKKLNALKTMEGAEVVGFIQSTSDYSKIHIHPLNREIQREHVEKLKQSMLEENMLIPVLINQDGYVIDGNHRTTAWMELHYPIYFYIVENYNVIHMQKMNALQLNWNLEDYLQHYVTKEKETYIKFNNLINKYKINITDLFYLISKFAEIDIKESEISYIFKKGDLNIDFFDKIEEFLIELKLFDNYKYNKEQGFVRAFFQLYMTDFYDKEYIRHRIDVSQYTLVKGKRSTIKEYCKFLAETLYRKTKDGHDVIYHQDSNMFYSLDNKKGRKKKVS